MKQALVLFLGLIFYTSFFSSQNPVSQSAPQRNSDTVSADLLKLTNTWNEAINSKNRAELEPLMAPEFALYRWNGELLAPRPDWLKFLDDTEIKEYTVRGVSPKVYGDFAIVTSVCTWAGVHSGRSFDYDSIMVDTWRKTNGKWQVVARNSCSPTPATASTPSPCSR
jgi:ketosteroid isomerase-like protein